MKPTLVVILALVACGNDHAVFRPTDNVTRSGPGGRPAASYDIRADSQHDAHARVNVWSRGAYVEGGRTYARLALELRNTGDEPLAFDASLLQLDMFGNNGADLPRANLVRSTATHGTYQVMPGDTTTIDMLYALPIALDPDRIGSMRLRWAVEHVDDRRYVQFTDFRRVREPSTTSGFVYYDPVFGVYDPFLYGPPYGYHTYHRYPVRRVIIEPRDQRPTQTVRRDR